MTFKGELRPGGRQPRPTIDSKSRVTAVSATLEGEREIREWERREGGE